jgi:hypothetical protein
MKRSRPVVFTVKHSTRSVEEPVEILPAHRVERVVDVRNDAALAVQSAVQSRIAKQGLAKSATKLPPHESFRSQSPRTIARNTFELRLVRAFRLDLVVLGTTPLPAQRRESLGQQDPIAEWCHAAWTVELAVIQRSPPKG